MMITPLLAVHLADGQISMAPVSVAWILCLLVLLTTCWKLSEDEAPGVALFAGVFFLGSLLSIPVPAGPKTHLLLTGMVGMILGARAFPAIMMGCAMQALLFAHGGPTSIAMNSLVMGLPAVLVGSIGRRMVANVGKPGMVRLIGFATGASAAILTVMIHAGVLLVWGQGSWATSALALVAIHLPLMLIEGFVSAAVVGLVWRARPGMLGIRESVSVALFLLFLAVSSQANAAWHRLQVEAKRDQRGCVEVIARFSADQPAGPGEVVLQDSDGYERHRVTLIDGRAVLKDVDTGNWLVRVWASDHYGETELDLGNNSSSNAQLEARLNWMAVLAGVAFILSVASLLKLRSLERKVDSLKNHAPGEKPAGYRSDKGSDQSPSPT